MRFEASAFAEWSGMRLPTEFEWEAACDRFEWGKRWEWTNSAYLPYPGFKAAPGAVAALTRWLGSPSDVELLVDNIHVLGGAESVKSLKSLIPVSLLCVGTPSRKNGSLDLTYLTRVCEEIGHVIKDKDDYHVVVVRSTVLPGTTHAHVIPALEAASGKKYGDDFATTRALRVIAESEAPTRSPEREDGVHPSSDDEVLAEYGSVALRNGRLIERLHFDRFSSTPLETSGALVEYDRGTGQWTLHANNQFPGFAIIMMGPALRTGMDKLRFVSQDIGGGFGIKFFAPKACVIAGMASKTAFARAVRSDWLRATLP